MATQLGDGIWWFDLRGVNAYLIEDDVLTLVDAGTPLGARAIAAGIEETGHAVADIERVLLTHYDMDHVGALDRLDDLDAVVRAGAADARVLTGDAKPPWRNHKGAFQRAMGPFVGTPDLPVAPIDDGEAVGSFTAYHTPGHTPGHTAFVSEERSAGFLGDLVFESAGALTVSAWPMSYDTREAAASVRSLAECAPVFDGLGMGHGVPFVRDGDQRLADLARSLR
ncbi:MBL fold metallo-hydrolase [Halococcus saccharolyticus]|uniref:Beta-lactamase n=1 Tax=Halococcus saccharolyticus DSM 5350 TaxID=1227455 RepID=M0ME83_9EURY|nr:MBL fold metallo-hydrolase [Halococcus saccharolyticus]EMA44067.1 beta-lactamase [Halococcus saccharolyticus DSM 5350]